MSTKSKKINVKDHPYLRQVQEQEQRRLADFMEKITGNKLNTEDKKTKKDIEQSKATFTKVQKGVEIKVMSQNRTYRAKIIDDSQSKMEKKVEKANRKEAERQSFGASGLATDKKQSFKDKHMKNLRKQEKDVDDDDGLGESEGDQDMGNQDDLDEARKELNKMIGWAKSDKYRKRDNEQIIESRPDEIERQEKISRRIAQEEDLEAEMQERRRKQMKKMKRLKRTQQNSEDEGRSATDKPRKPREDEDRDDN